LFSLSLLLSLVRDNNLHFVEAPALAPPEVAYDQNDMIRYEQELTEAAAMPLPDVRINCLCLVSCVIIFVLFDVCLSLSYALSVCAVAEICDFGRSLSSFFLPPPTPNKTHRRTTTCKAAVVGAAAAAAARATS